MEHSYWIIALLIKTNWLFRCVDMSTLNPTLALTLRLAGVVDVSARVLCVTGLLSKVQ